ncbi:MAG: CBS domain-containing protein [Pseudomonadota bacterium]
MKIAQVLKQKASMHVETAAAQMSVAEVAGILASKKIGALVVTRPDGSISGIVSERDVVRHVGSEGPSALSKPVHAIMTARVEHCSPDEETLSVLARMTNGRFRHMPVLEDGQMIGVLSIGDVVKARIDELAAENEAMAAMLAG